LALIFNVGQVKKIKMENVEFFQDCVAEAITFTEFPILNFVNITLENYHLAILDYLAKHSLDLATRRLIINTAIKRREIPISADADMFADIIYRFPDVSFLEGLYASSYKEAKNFIFFILKKLPLDASVEAAQLLLRNNSIDVEDFIIMKVDQLQINDIDIEPVAEITEPAIIRLSKKQLDEDEKAFGQLEKMYRKMSTARGG
jgi:hypothetical protein